jgi:Icc-related predicted phosphoesterase
MNIWHISDTHTYHGLLTVPEDIDMVIFSGDCSNPRDPYLNKEEVLNFVEWMKNLPIPYKVFVAGNHDISIEAKFFKKEFWDDAGIIYLENEWKILETGLKIYGSPQTPSFGSGWAFNKKRDKMHEHWQKIPEDVDIIVTHGPPKGILDLSRDAMHQLERCGDEALRKRIIEIKPRLVCFGHIHNNEDIVNAGTMKLSNYDIRFSNGSVVTDGKFGRLSSNGNIFEL